MKKGKGMPKIVSNVRKLRKLFENSPTRGTPEMLSQLSKQDFNLNLLTTTASARDSVRTNQAGENILHKMDFYWTRIGQTGPGWVVEDQSEGLLRRTRLVGTKSEK